MSTTYRDYSVTNYSQPNEGYVLPKHFGAVGDDITDDTFALQQWLNSPVTNKSLGSKTYRVTGKLYVSVTGTIITGPGGLRADTAALDVLNVDASDVKVMGITINGNSKARYLIFSTGDRNVFEGNRLYGAYSATNSPRGIYTSNAGGVIIRNNHISDINGPGNANQGDSNGMTRAIVMHSISTPTAPSICEGNFIDNITGEEADGIALLYSDTVSNIYLPARTIVRNNYIRNCTRRYIKIQASDVIVDGNFCWSDGIAVVNPSAIIDVIQGNNIEIVNNRVEDNGLTSPISIAGVSTSERISNIRIANNYLYEKENANPVIYISHSNQVTIQGNTMVGGQYYVSGGTCDELVVAQNVCRGGNVANVSFNFTSSVVGKVRTNTIPTGRSIGTSTNVVFDGNS